MKLQFKHQKFQADAAKAVVDVFAGQPYLTPSYMMDRGAGAYQYAITDEEDFTGCSNAKLVPELNDRIILEHIQKIQRTNLIAPSQKLEGRFNLTVEMETGVGKTYTYIKTMYELNKHYDWSKFIVVVPSVAIREGVYKSFQMTQEHFAEEYGKKVRFFIYNSAQLTEIDRFASDSSINVMIINSQAFNAKGKDARRIYMKLDEFRSRRPIDIIAKTNPIVIIDEPQSVEGKQTKVRLKEFNPLMTLRYSATHKSDSIYNMIYRLDAMEAYNKCLVKKIAVKGITETGSTATEGYVYLESINLSKSDPTATLQFDFKGAGGIRKKSMKVGIGFNLYDKSGYLDEYKNGFVVKSIDGRDDSVEFINGIKIYVGDVIGKAMQPENACRNNVELAVDESKFAMPEFKALWTKINSKSVYVVDFDTEELVKKSIASLNMNLHVPKIYFKVESGSMDHIASKDPLVFGEVFVKETSDSYSTGNKIAVNSRVKYDLIGKLVEATSLTRKAIIQILTGIEKSVFDQFKDNPEEFIIKAGSLINDEKATAIIEHITYDVLDEKYDTDVFTAPTIKGKLGVNAMKTNKHLYDHIVYDSTKEKEFAEELDISSDVAVYVKLPEGFYITTPVGHYNPDWAIAFYEDNIKHIYFVAETKGSMNSMQLRMIEESKIHCAREHFKAISNGNVVYDVVDSYQSLLDKVMK